LIGIDPKLKPFIDEYERMGLKPATMLMKGHSKKFSDIMKFFL